MLKAQAGARADQLAYDPERLGDAAVFRDACVKALRYFRTESRGKCLGDRRVSHERWTVVHRHQLYAAVARDAVAASEVVDGGGATGILRALECMSKTPFEVPDGQTTVAESTEVLSLAMEIEVEVARRRGALR
jgi:hypothetical protein